MTRLVITCSALIAAAAMAALAYAQEFGWYRGRMVVQNDPPKTELIVARWHFGTNDNVGHMGWAHNYPESDQNLNVFLERTTALNVDAMSYRIVELGSDEVFDYPFAYVSEPGEMLLTEPEVENLREYLKRGGFVLVDDFDGPWQLEQFRSQLRRAFPSQPLITLPMEHRLFHAHFDLNDLQGMSEHVSGGVIAYLALLDDQGRAVVVAGHNNDLANFWEWYDTPSMPLKPGTDAFANASKPAHPESAHPELVEGVEGDATLRHFDRHAAQLRWHSDNQTAGECSRLHRHDLHPCRPAP